jgi:hypothetical protein
MRPLLPSLAAVARGRGVYMSAPKRAAMVQRHLFSTENAPSSSQNAQAQADAAKAVESSVGPDVLHSILSCFVYLGLGQAVSRASSSIGAKC